MIHVRIYYDDYFRGCKIKKIFYETLKENGMKDKISLSLEPIKEYFLEKNRNEIDILLINLGISNEKRKLEILVILKEADIINFNEYSKEIFASVIEPIDDDKVSQCLSRLLKTMHLKTTVEVIGFGGKKITTDKIYHINSEHIYSRLYTEYGEFLVRKPLKEWEQELNGYNFFRINRSCIINMEMIEKIKGRQIFIKDKRYIISESKIKEFLDSYMI